LRWAGLQTDSAPDMQQLREHGIDRLADCLADHLNMEQLFALLASWEQQHAN
jgi:adenosylcobyric acid synthase